MRWEYHIELIMWSDIKPIFISFKTRYRKNIICDHSWGLFHPILNTKNGSLNKELSLKLPVWINLAFLVVPPKLEPPPSPHTFLLPLFKSKDRVGKRGISKQLSSDLMKFSLSKALFVEPDAWGSGVPLIKVLTCFDMHEWVLSLCFSVLCLYNHFFSLSKCFWCF